MSSFVWNLFVQEYFLCPRLNQIKFDMQLTIVICTMCNVFVQENCLCSGLQKLCEVMRHHFLCLPTPVILYSYCARDHDIIINDVHLDCVQNSLKTLHILQITIINHMSNFIWFIPGFLLDFEIQIVGFSYFKSKTAFL